MRGAHRDLYRDNVPDMCLRFGGRFLGSQTGGYTVLPGVPPVWARYRSFPCSRAVARTDRWHASAPQARDLLPTARRWGEAPQTRPPGKRYGTPPAGTAAVILCRHSCANPWPRSRQVGPKNGPVSGAGNGTDLGVGFHTETCRHACGP